MLTLAQKKELVKFATRVGTQFFSAPSPETIATYGQWMLYPRPNGMDDDQYLSELKDLILEQFHWSEGRFA